MDYKRGRKEMKQRNSRITTLSTLALIVAAIVVMSLLL